MTSTSSGPRSAVLTVRRRSIAVWKAARRPASRPSAAARSASGSTRNDFGTTWSKRSEYAAIAAAPSWATSSQMGRTTSIAASTSNSARGTSPA